MTLKSKAFSELDELTAIDRSFDGLVLKIQRLTRKTEDQRLSCELLDCMSQLTTTYSELKKLRVSYGRFCMMKKQSGHRHGECDD